MATLTLCSPIGRIDGAPAKPHDVIVLEREVGLMNAKRLVWVAGLVCVALCYRMLDMYAVACSVSAPKASIRQVLTVALRAPYKFATPTSQCGLDSNSRSFQACLRVGNQTATIWYPKHSTIPTVLVGKLAHNVRTA